MGMQTDILGNEVVYEAGLTRGQMDTKQGAGILKKTLTQATKSYGPKHTKNVRPFKMREEDDYMLPMANPIKEGDLNQGIQKLLDRGLIPKDVDLTVAFETGAAPVTCKGV